MSNRSGGTILGWIGFLILGIIIIVLMDLIGTFVFLFIGYLANGVLEYFDSLSLVQIIFIMFILGWLVFGIFELMWNGALIVISSGIYYGFNTIFKLIPVKGYSLGTYLLIIFTLFQLIINLYFTWTDPTIISRISLTIGRVIVFLLIAFTCLEIKEKGNELS